MYFEEFSIGRLTVREIVGANTITGPGNKYYLDPTNGSDGNSGESPWEAKKTLAAGYAKLEAGQHDTLVYIPGSSSISIESGGLTWAKDYTHFVGLGAHSGVGQRARMFADAANTDASMVTLSATGCIFKGLMFHYGVASAAAKYCFTLTGARNLIEDCAIKGIGDNAQDVTDAASLFLNGAEENLFRGCDIGLDSTARGSAVNTEIFVDGGAVRNKFIECELVAYLEADTHTFIDFNDTTSHDRWMKFIRCNFLAESEDNIITMASLITLPSSHQTTYVLMDHCSKTNVTDWEVNNRGQVFTVGPDGGTAGTGCGDAVKVV